MNKGVNDMPAKIDLTNKKFGCLQVLKQADNIQTPNGRSHIAWLCECECGNQIVVCGDNLRNGHTVSCGCKKNVKCFQKQGKIE